MLAQLVCPPVEPLWGATACCHSALRAHQTLTTVALIALRTVHNNDSSPLRNGTRLRRPRWASPVMYAPAEPCKRTYYHPSYLGDYDAAYQNGGAHKHSIV